MPEGDTIYKVAEILRRDLAGKTLQRGRLASVPEASLGGRRIDGVTARGKNLFLTFDDGVSLRSHLGMHGSWHRYASGEPWRRPGRQASIVLETGPLVFVCFNAKEVEFVRGGGVRDRQFTNRLGPDLCRDGIDLGGIPQRARALLDPDTAVSDLLLDQRVAAGIGNVYKNEILFVHGLHPLRTLASLDDGRVLCLFETARDLLRRNLGPGPRVTRFVRDGSGAKWVYHRLGRPCHTCGTRIRYARLGKTHRSTYWCPTCQR